MNFSAAGNLFFILSLCIHFRVHQDNIKLHEKQQTPSQEKILTMKRAMDVAEQSANLYILQCLAGQGILKACSSWDIRNVKTCECLSSYHLLGYASPFDICPILQGHIDKRNPRLNGYSDCYFSYFFHEEMLWTLTGSVLMRRFQWAPKHFFQSNIKEIFLISVWRKNKSFLLLWTEADIL